MNAEDLWSLIEHNDTPMPALNPIKTGSEMKFATKPSRRIEARKSIAPTNNASVAEAVSSEAGSPFGTTSPSSAAANMARVVVVLTLSTHEVPRTA
jgi:hypothetical protein